jgi:hypothetical protein
MASVLILLFTVLFVSDGLPYMYGENALIKLVKSCSYNLIIFIFSYVIFFLSDRVSINYISSILHYCFYFLLSYAALEYFNIYKFPFLHTAYEGVFYGLNRVQLTTPEPSIAAPLFSTICMLVIILRTHLKKGLSGTVIISLLSILVFLAIASRGAFIITLSLVWAIRRHLTIKTIILAIVICIPLIMYLSATIIPALAKDIDEFNSVSTRLTTACAAAYGLLFYPLGEGYGTYLFYFPRLVFPVFNWIVQLTGIPFLSWEIDYMVTTGKTLIPKCGVMSEIMYNGIIAIAFIVFIFKYLSRLASRILSPRLKILWTLIMSYLFFSFLISVSIETSYFFVLPIVILLRILHDESSVKSRSMLSDESTND